MSFFGVPRPALLLGVLALGLPLALGLAGWALRNPLLARLALRNVPRRPGLAALVTLGLTLGTVILSTAFTTGDTMSLAVRSVVAGALGSADEVVFVARASGSRSGFELGQAIASGSLLTGLAAYFPASAFQRVADVLRDDERVAAVVPAVIEQAAVASPSQAFRARLNLIGVPPDAPGRLGTLRAQDGAPLDLGALAPDEVYVNTEAASALGVGPGDRLRIFELASEAEVQVRAVARVGDLGGAQAALFLPLARLQQLAGHPNELNQVLIANRGTPDQRLASSWPITVELRAAFLDAATAGRLYRAFSAPAARQALATAAARAAEPQAGRLRRLLRELDAGRPTPEFVALVQDPELLGRLASAVPGASRGVDAGPFALLPGVGQATFRVLDVQRVAQDQADRWGSAFTELFVVLGLFSLASGVLLIVLVFSLLALERRGELGVMRALGGRRRDVVLVLALEGGVYSLISSVGGLVAGIGLGFGLVGLAGTLVAQYGFRLEPAVEPASLAISFGLGVILTFVTLTATAWWASRFSIVTAMGDLPDPAGGRPRAAWLLAHGLLLVAGIALARLGLGRLWSVAYAGGVTLSIVGGALVTGWLARRLGARRAERVVFTLAGVALVGWWSVPPERLAAARLPAFPRVAEMSVLSGLGMLLGAVWLIAYNVGLLRVARGWGPRWRLSVAYIAGHRFRTGLTLAMFGLVVLSLTLGAVLLTATTAAYGDPGAATGGWDIRADSSRPPRDLRAELAAGPVTPAAFSAIGATATRAIQAVQLPGPPPKAPPGPQAARWQSASLTQVDDGFTRGVTAHLTAAVGEQRATWRELTRRPGTAVVGASLLRAPSGGFRVVADEGRGFRPFVVWVRDPRSRGPAVRLEVVGIVDGRGPFGSSLLVGDETLAAWPAADRSSYFFAVPPAASARELAAGLTLAAPDLRAQPIGEELRLVQGVRGLLDLILHGFMGIGLLAGVSALGVISLRSVVERRRQIGVLRALGFASRGVGLGLMIEAGLVALLGALVGAGVGLAVARGTVEFLARRSPELRFGVPWDQVGLVVLAAIAASLLMTLLPARQAARLAPAEALREG